MSKIGCAGFFATFARRPYWLFLVCALVHGQGLPIPPYAPVIDYAQVLQPQEVASLVEELASIRSRTGASVAVLIEKTTQPESIEEFSNRVASDWKLGGKGNGIGVLIVLAVQDRTARIEVSRGLEGALPDLYAKRILKETMSVDLAKGEYHRGVLNGIHRISSVIQREVQPTQSRPENESRRGTPIETALLGSLFVFVFLGLWLTLALVSKWAAKYLSVPVGSVLGLFQGVAGTAAAPAIGWSTGFLVAAIGIGLPWWFVRRNRSRDELTELERPVKKKRGEKNSTASSGSTVGNAGSSRSDDDESSGSADERSSSGGGGSYAGGGASDKW